MTSALELLPAELLTDILGRLRYADVATLLPCSKKIRQRVEPMLYRSKFAVNKAMCWACKQNSLRTIHLAISYGANVSVFEVYANPGYNLVPIAQVESEATSNIKASTLQIAARKKSVEAFALLLELGAKVDEVDPTQLKFFTYRFYSSVNEAILCDFLKAGLKHQIGENFNINLALVKTIQRGGSADLVGALLDDGADPNYLDSHGDTPLTTAIMRNSIPIFDLLIEKGALIHGEFGPGIPWRGPLHIPVFAAACAMVKHGPTMMQRCLDGGANINHCYPLADRRAPYRAHLGHKSFYTSITPLLFYLDSIESWRPVDTGLRPIDGLKYLLEHHAVLDDLNIQASDHKIGMQSSLKLLLDRWGLEKLLDPEFLVTVMFLVENGAAKRHTDEVLSNYHGHCYYPEDINILTVWRRLVDLFLKHRDPDLEKLDYILIRTIMASAPRGTGSRPGALNRCTIDCLVEAGANINAPMDKSGHTVLHRLCSDVHFDLMYYEIGVHAVLRIEDRLQFFEHMVDSGANPNIAVDGRTAIDILKEQEDSSLEAWDEYLSNLVNILQGKKASV